MSTALSTAIDNANTKKHPPEVANKINLIRAMHGELDEWIPPVLKAQLTPERICNIVIGAFRSVPHLDECSFESIAGGIMAAAQLGLEPCTQLKLCFLIPRWNKDKKCYDAQFMLGYQGMMELARRSGMVDRFETATVRERDEFVFEKGLQPKLWLRPNWKGDPGKPVGYYGLIALAGSGPVFDAWPYQQMMYHRDRFAPRNREGYMVGPWVNDPDPMGEKTMIRHIFKLAPKSSIELARASAYDDRVLARDAPGDGVRAIEDDRPTQFQIPIDTKATQTSPAPEQTASTETTQEPARKAAARTPTASRKQAAPAKPEPQKEAPFDHRQPAHDTTVRERPAANAKPAEAKVPTLAEKVGTIEKWFKDATLMHESDGFPDLAKRDGLMERIYEHMLANDERLKVDAKGFFSCANEIARLNDSLAEIENELRAANKIVRDEYAGIPAENASEGEPPAGAETEQAKTVVMDKYFAEQAQFFAENGFPAFAKPVSLVTQVHYKAVKAGVLKTHAEGYRKCLSDLIAIADTAQEILAVVEPFLDAIWEEISQASDNEPGSNG